MNQFWSNFLVVGHCPRRNWLVFGDDAVNVRFRHGFLISVLGISLGNFWRLTMVQGTRINWQSCCIGQVAALFFLAEVWGLRSFLVLKVGGESLPSEAVVVQVFVSAVLTHSVSLRCIKNNVDFYCNIFPHLTLDMNQVGLNLSHSVD